MSAALADASAGRLPRRARERHAGGRRRPRHRARQRHRAAAVAAAAGKTLRPHAKTHKLPQIARLQLDAGAVGIQVAKLGEAEVMVDGGLDDVLVGYPIVGEAKLARLIALAERARISVSLDSLEVAEGISAAAAAAGVEVALLIEIDTGMKRLGQHPGSRPRISPNRWQRFRASGSPVSSPMRGTSMQRGTARAEGAPDARSLRPGRRDRRADPQPRHPGRDGLGRFCGHVPIRRRLPRRDRGPARDLRLQRSQPARAGGRHRGGRRCLRRHDRRQPAGTGPPGRRRRVEGDDLGSDADGGSARELRTRDRS